MGTLLLAWRYISYHRVRTAILVAAISLTIFLPLATRWVIARFESEAFARARNTPLVIGAKGSRFAMAVHALYFRGESPPAIKYSEIERIAEMGLAKAIPVHSRFSAQGFPVVGTTPDYFAARKLVLASGDALDRLGDCVVGCKVAQQLVLKSGDRLISESDNMFDLSGAAPLKMRVMGVLAESGTADDTAIFCDIKTTWIMEGIGHGHASKPSENGEEHTHEASKQLLQQHQEVTDENASSFHFHGRRSDYPITAIIAIPDSERSETLMQGKYLDPNQAHQIIRPMDVVTELMEVISRVRQLAEFGMICLMVATIMLVLLVLLLSMRLRQREMRTMFLLGSSRGTTAQVVLTELVLVVAFSSAVALLAALIISQFAETLMIRLI
jgi:putative ABC transport system permease protein